jgi:dATP/dGTP diphosphohydrolase
MAVETPGVQVQPRTLPSDAKARKNIPLATGVLDYFPAALAAVAEVSKAGNDQHNPGEPLHWSRGKSNDHADTAVRHLLERGEIDTDGQRHTAKAAWRVLALLQIELEEAGVAPISRGSK